MGEGEKKKRWGVAVRPSPQPSPSRRGRKEERVCRGQALSPTVSQWERGSGKRKTWGCVAVRPFLSVPFPKGRGCKDKSPSPNGRGLGRGPEETHLPTSLFPLPQGGGNASSSLTQGAKIPTVKRSRHYRGGYQVAGLAELARELRAKETDAEALLWQLLRRRQLLGFKFRRQHQFGDYLADFYCHEACLVIECD